MIQDQRVIYGSTDISVAVNNFRSANAAFAYTTGEYLYIGSILPFNNLWFETGVANTEATNLSLSIWWGNAWESAVDILDETDGLTKTGRINFSTNRLKGWDIEQTTDDVAGLEAFEIYWRYWVRLSWSASFSNTTTIAYVGQKFSDESSLYSYYPDLSQTDVLTGFKADKTDWKEQHYMAAEHIVMDLKKRDIIKSRGQLLDWSLFQEASCHRVAEMVYTAFGRPYFDQLLEARRSYSNAMNLKNYSVDLNQDGNLSHYERKITTNFVTR